MCPGKISLPTPLVTPVILLCQISDEKSEKRTEEYYYIAFAAVEKKGTKGQTSIYKTTIYKTLHIKLKIGSH